MQQLDRLLLHPNIQRLGGVQALISAGLFAWGIVKGVDPLIAVGVTLFAANVVLLMWPRARRREVASREPPFRPDHLAHRATGSMRPTVAPPVGRLTPGARHYGSGAIQQAIFEQARNEARASIEAELVAAIDEGEKLRGDEFSGNPSLAEFDAWRAPIVEFVERVFGEAEKQRLQEVKWNGYEVRDHIGGVLDWLRALRDRPDSWQVQVDGEELEAAIKALRPSQRHDPTDRREFGRRDDREDLAQRCHMLAGSLERWVEAFRRGHSERAERLVEEWLKADPKIDPADARRKAYTRDEKNWETDYRLKYEAEAKKLFEEAWELGEIAKEHEQLAVRPLAIQFEEVPKLFKEIAESLYAKAA